MKITSEIIQENPNLPILAWVNTEVVADADYSKWLGEITNAEVKEYLLFEQDKATYTVTRDDTEIIEQYLWDNRELYLNITERGKLGSKRERLKQQEDEFEARIQDYLDNLDWQKAIFINIKTPSNAKNVEFKIMRGKNYISQDTIDAMNEIAYNDI